MPCIINENRCLIIDGNYVLTKADTIADRLACIYHNELLFQIDNSNKTP